MALQADGAIVVAGYSSNGSNNDVALARYARGPIGTGDYNDDGVVDAADYVLWRKTLRTIDVPPYSGADGNGSGAVDPGDYGVWRAHFGQTDHLPSSAHKPNPRQSRCLSWQMVVPLLSL
jgi:hypothetical protein